MNHSTSLTHRKTPATPARPRACACCARTPSQETKRHNKPARQLSAAAGRKTARRAHSGPKRRTGRAYLRGSRRGGCDNRGNGARSRRRQLRPVERKFVRPARPACKTAIRSQLDLPSQITKPPIRDALHQPSAHRGRLDAQHAGNRRRTAQQFNDFSVSHARIVRYSYGKVNRHTLALSE
jgi:hypothetical protein